jgi:hypothetical protein
MKMTNGDMRATACIAVRSREMPKIGAGDINTVSRR